MEWNANAKWLIQCSIYEQLCIEIRWTHAKIWRFITARGSNRYPRLYVYDDVRVA